MISEEIMTELKCASLDHDHFVIKPITLPTCGHTICKTCIPKDANQGIKCKLCGFVTKQDLTEFKVSSAAQTLLKICIVDIFKLLERETSLKLNEIKGMI